MPFKNFKRTLIGGLCLISTSALFAQLPVDGFYPKKNSLVAALSYDYKSFDEFYVGSELGDENPAGLGEITSSIISIYAQYGITDRISATLTLPYISVSSEDGVDDPVLLTDKVDGLQDLGLYLKGLIFEKSFEDSSKFSLGGAMGVSFPLGDYEGGAILSLGNEATSLKAEGILHYESSFRVFAEAKIGSSVNSSDDFVIPPALLYSFKLGYLHQYFYAHAELDIQNSLSGTDIGGPNFGGPATLPETEVDYTRLLLTAYVPVFKDSLGVSANFNTTLDGRNVNNETGLGLGLVYNFK